MKTKIRTESLDVRRDQRREQVSETAVAVFAPEHEIKWMSGSAFATIHVAGVDSDLVSDSIRRFLLHKFPLLHPKTKNES